MKIAVSTGNSRMDKKWNLTEMELEDFRERISKTPVSYTHLDVYKRQHMNCINVRTLKADKRVTPEYRDAIHRLKLVR